MLVLPLRFSNRQMRGYIMMQSEERIRLFLRMLELVTISFKAIGADPGYSPQMVALKWVLGEAPDPPNLDDGFIARLEEAVAKQLAETK